MTRLTRTLLLALGLSAATLFTGGCSSDISSADLRSDGTPELLSSTRSSEQYYNKRAIVRDNTRRQLYDDWALIWLEDRNLKLSRYTLP